MEDAVSLSREEALELYRALAARREAPDEVLGRVIAKLEGYLYRTLTIEEIERLRGATDRSGPARPGR